MRTRDSSQEVDSAKDGAATDGRRRRRELGRVAVVDAVIDLILDGGRAPTAEQIAERADVSVASVYRYFETLEELRRLGVQRYFERIDHLIAIPDIGEGPLPRRIDSLVSSRLEFYRITEPMARMARHQALDIEQMRSTLARVRATLADQVAQHFAPELAHLSPSALQDRVAVIAALTSFEAWDLLQEQGLDRVAVGRAWRTHLATILTAG